MGTFQNRAKVVDSFCGDGSCLAGGFLKTVNWNLKGAQKFQENSMETLWKLYVIFMLLGLTGDIFLEPPSRTL